MNERITQLAVEAGLLNYVDLETPRRYFVSGDAGLEEVEKFAESLIQECIDIISPYAINIVNPGKPRMVDPGTYPGKPPNPIDEIKRNFGIK